MICPGRAIHEGGTTRSRSGVEVTRLERTLVTPFWVRLATETSFSAGWLLIIFPAVLYPLYLALEALFGRGVAAATDFGGDFWARNPLAISTTLGYIAMMYTYAARGTFRDLEALRPVLPGREGTYAELREQLTQFDRRRLWIGGLIAFVFGCVLSEIGVGPWVERIRAGEWSLRDAWGSLIFLAFWITAGRGTVYLIDSARLYSRIGERYVAVDLLDLGPLSSLTRHGLRIVLLLTIITAATVIVYSVGSASARGSAMVMIYLGSLWSVPLAGAAFVLPVRGLRRQIRVCKAEELSRLREKIRRNRELADGSGAESAEAGARLPGLLAFEKRIESVREWPFDAPTLTRFFLYVAIPIGGWIGGALVERLLGVALD
jgi:hypothetical protein